MVSTTNSTGSWKQREYESRTDPTLKNSLFWVPQLPAFDNYDLVWEMRSIDGYIIKYTGENQDEYQQLDIMGIDVGGMHYQPAGMVDMDLSTTSVYPHISYDTNDSKILDVEDVWAAGYNGTGLTVSVIDTGINFEYRPMLNKRAASFSLVREEYGYLQDEGPEDGHGHGTAVASLIAGYGPTMNQPFYGMAFGAMLVGIKVFSSHGGSGTTAAIAVAMDWSNSNDTIDVINMSLGGDDEDGGNEILEQLVIAGTLLGKTYVISAGNSGSEGEFERDPFTIGAPGSSVAAITAGAVNYSIMLAEFSSEGPTAQYLAKPDVVAPGVSVRAAGSLGSATRASGTSFSAPLTAGVATLGVDILKKNGIEYNPGKIKSALALSATDLGLPWHQQGNGLVNATGMMELLLAGNHSYAFPSNIPEMFWKEIPVGETIQYPITLTSSALGTWTIQSVTGNISGYLSLEVGDQPAYSSVYYVGMTIPIDATLGWYSGEVTLLAPDGTTSTFNISVKVREPAKARVLMDLVHTIWDSIGLERIMHAEMNSFVEFLKQQNVWVDAFDYGSITLERLTDYDILFIPSAFNFFENTVDDFRFTLDLEFEELKAIDAYLDQGGKLILDFGGTTELDGIYTDLHPDEGSVVSLLSLLGISSSNVTSYEVNSATTGGFTNLNGFTSSTGEANMIGGMAVMTVNGDSTAIATIGPGGSKVFVNSARNWRDATAMEDTSLNGHTDFINALFNWMTQTTGIQSFDYTIDDVSTVLYFDGDGSNSVFSIDIVQYGTSIPDINLSQDGDTHIVSIGHQVTGSIDMVITYGSQTYSFNRYLDKDPAELSMSFISNAAQLRYEGRIDAVDARIVPEGNFNFIFDEPIANVLNLTYNDGSFEFNFTKEHITSGLIPEGSYDLVIEAYDQNGNYQSFTTSFTVDLSELPDPVVSIVTPSSEESGFLSVFGLSSFIVIPALKRWKFRKNE
ncbi:MAG: S8 family serine peptidase [Candidatus Heimdallarchaeota archaeon]|nr:S8 family serine peptidase [Candidatus Heimdallarchaeota archaeon]